MKVHIFNDRIIVIYSMLLQMNADGNLKYGDLAKMASNFNVHWHAVKHI